MLLLELFNKGVEWDFMPGYHPARQGGVTGLVKAEFEIEIKDPNSSKMFKNYEVEFNVFLEGDDLTDPDFPKLAPAINKGSKIWQVAFGLRNQRNSTGITGTGDELTVFTTVMDIMKVCSTKYKMWNLAFSAHESNRAHLYKRMASRLAKDTFDVYTPAQLDIPEDGVMEENLLFLFSK